MVSAITKGPMIIAYSLDRLGAVSHVARTAQKTVPKTKSFRQAPAHARQILENGIIRRTFKACGKKRKITVVVAPATRILIYIPAAFA